ncbi:MAG: ATP-binding protein [Ardenticatenaceae bacterium]|nr:ATP-binding protein [Anaerolineales bacterium]MCB8922838.1 ATP-binding protein [Ardenticatenaceae bacterium]
MESVTEILKKNYDPKSLRNTGTSSSASPVDTGLGKADCPHCGGLGYVIPDVPPIDPRFGRAVPCACRATEREMARMDSLMRMSQLGHLQGCTFESFLPDGHGITPARQRNLRMAYDMALQYAQEPQGWLVFKGGYGCGKTHLAAAIANHRLAMGHSVLFVSVPDLLDHLRATYAPGSAINYDQRFEQVRNAPLLILDDLGSQSNTEWAQEKLYQIFNHRYNGRLPTIITTNQELESIEIRIQSRMVDPALVHIIHIAAPDFRRAGVDQEQSDLSTLNLHRDQTFDTFDLRQGELPRAQAENLRRAFDTAKEFAEAPQDWLVLNSVGFGNGKTHLAAAVANHIANQGEPVLFIMVPDLLDHLRATFNPSSGTRLDKRFDEVKTAPLLVLDDLGTESATAWAREKLYQLFNYRYNARLPTVITTATPVDELDPRLATRMLDGSRCTFFLLEIPSYRGGIKPKHTRTRRS